jgi:predicted MFS family arabinose efflux permease
VKGVSQPVEPVDQAALFTRAFILLGLAEFAYFTAVGVSIYVLPLYVTGPIGSDEAGAGVAFGAFAVTALVLRPFVGRLADSRGRLPLMLGGALLASVGLVATAYAESLAMVIALRLLLGVGEAAFFVASLAALADIAPPSRMGEAVSYNSLGLYLGFALGPPLGEWLVETWTYSTGWYAAALLAGLGAALSAGIGETRPPDLVRDDHGLIHRAAIPPALAFCTSLIAVGGFLTFAALHAADVGLTTTSLPLLVYGLIVVVCRVVFARVPDRIAPLRLGSAALATIAAGLVLMAIWQEPAGMLLGVGVMAVGISFSTPAFFAAILATAGPDRRGAASGTAGAMIDLGMGIGPIMLGVAAERAGIPWAFAAGACCAAGGAVFALGLHRRTLTSVT